MRWRTLRPKRSLPGTPTRAGCALPAGGTMGRKRATASDDFRRSSLPDAVADVQSAAASGRSWPAASVRGRADKLTCTEKPIPLPFWLFPWPNEPDHCERPQTCRFASGPPRGMRKLGAARRFLMRLRCVSSRAGVSLALADRIPDVLLAAGVASFYERVDLRAKQDGQPCNVEPHHQHHDCADAAVGGVVVRNCQLIIFTTSNEAYAVGA